MVFPGPRERRVAELLAVEGMCAAGSVTGGWGEGVVVGKARGFERVTRSQLSPLKNPALPE